MALETLDARLGKVMFHKPSKWSPSGDKYLIARTSTGETVKGFMDEPIEGEQYRFYGNRKTQQGRDEAAFEFSTFEVVIDRSEEGLAQYLARYIRGIGLGKARAIVEHFGGDTLAILEADPTRCSEVARVTEKDAAAISAHFNDPRRIDPVAFAALVELFQGHRIPRTVIESLARDHKGSAVGMVRDRPYSILLDYPRMGWVTVDALATTNLQFPLDGLDRQQAAIIEALTRISLEGHTYATKVEVEGEVYRLISMLPKSTAWDAVIADENVIVRPGPTGEEAALKALHIAEMTIADCIAKLTAGAKPLDKPLFTAEELVASGLNEDQLAAVETIENFGVCLLTGPPGTGKSYTVAKVIEALRSAGTLSIVVVAPTGKAAKRAEELISQAIGPNHGIPCQTIHKALSPSPSEMEGGTPASSAKFGRGRSEFGFARCEGSPIDASWIFADETSMDDVKIGADLLKAIAVGTRVVFIGDENQLPSVGPGSMLRDLIAADLPRITLSKIVRSDGGGRVVRACHAIKDGLRPETASKISLPTENWVHIEHEDPAEIAQEIVGLHRQTKTFADLFWDIQTVCPQRNTLMGCDNLNRLLSERLNPSAASEQQTEGERPQFRVGDKVVRLKNGKVDELVDLGPGANQANHSPNAIIASDDASTFLWRGQLHGLRPTAVVNGDMGTVADIVQTSKGGWAVVRFRYPDRLCRISMAESHLAMAYAMTVHKCVDPDTIVETSDGLMRISQIKREGEIATQDGMKAYRNFVSNPEGDMLTIQTEGGFSVQVTPDHGCEVWNGSAWSIIDAATVKLGDIMRLKLGATYDPETGPPLPSLPIGDVRATEHSVPRFVDADVAEFLGLMVGDGTVYRSGFRLVKRHPEVVARFAELCQQLFGATPSHLESTNCTGAEVNSTRLSAWLLSLGGLIPNEKMVPDCILRSPLAMQRSFLRGLFEDGSALLKDRSKLDSIQWSSAYQQLTDTVRLMLLRCNIISCSVVDRPGYVWIYGDHAKRFATDIGFITPFKQDRAITAEAREMKYIVPVSRDEIDELRVSLGCDFITKPLFYKWRAKGTICRDSAKRIIAGNLGTERLRNILRERLGFHHVRVKSIEPGRGPSMCVEVPEGHQFLQNGFPHGNCQGSGFPLVIAPVHSSFFFDDRKGVGIWSRELVYTAISRAEKLLITVGQFSAIEQAIRRKTVHRRNTRLVERLHASMPVFLTDTPY